MTIDKVRRALCGISGVHVTPYRRDAEIDPGTLAAIVDRLSNAGIHNIVSAGNTGEFYALTPDEVRLVHRVAIETVAGRTVVTAAVGRSLKEAIATGREAAAMGADAAMVHHPLDPFAAPSAQADYFIAIAEALPIPVVAYVRSDALGLEHLLRVAACPNIAGIKFAAANVVLLSECVRASGDLPAIWVCGLAEGWAAAFRALGARGFTSGLVNVWPERSLEILAALDRGDYESARTLVDAIAPFETMRTRHNNGANVTVVKTAMELLGIPVGPVRRPGLPALDDADRKKLAAILGAWRLRSVAANPMVRAV